MSSSALSCKFDGLAGVSEASTSGNANQVSFCTTCSGCSSQSSSGNACSTSEVAKESEITSEMTTYSKRRRLDAGTVLIIPVCHSAVQEPATPRSNHPTPEAFAWDAAQQLPSGTGAACPQPLCSPAVAQADFGTPCDFLIPSKASIIPDAPRRDPYLRPIPRSAQPSAAAATQQAEHKGRTAAPRPVARRLQFNDDSFLTPSLCVYAPRPCVALDIAALLAACGEQSHGSTCPSSVSSMSGISMSDGGISMSDVSMSALPASPSCSSAPLWGDLM